MKRILVYGQLPPPHHGSNIMTKIFMEALTGSGYEAVLIDKGFSRNISEVNRFKLSKIFRLMSLINRYRRGLTRQKPDLAVFFISSRLMGFAIDRLLVNLTERRRVPVLLYVHTSGPGRLFDKGGWRRSVVAGLFKAAAACILLDDIFVPDTRRYFAGPIHILPNCLEDKAPAKKADGPDNAKTGKRVLFLSNIELNKGILTLLDAVPRVQERGHGDAVFIIAGPWMNPRIRRLVDERVESRGLTSIVKFRGAVYGEDKLRLMASSDIFVFPSFIDAMGLVILEALRAGLPVVASRVGGASRMVLENTSGFLFAPGDSKRLADRISDLLDNPELRKQMSREARRLFVEKFSIKTYRTRLSEILSAVDKDVDHEEA